MGEAPQDYTVDAVSDDGSQVKVSGIDLGLDVLPKGTPVSVGQEIRGWLNLAGKYGPYLKIAEDRQSSNNGKSDEGIIWGWATNLAVQELAYGIPHEQVAQRAEQIIAHRATASARTSQLPPADSEPQGADSGSSLTPKVPF